MTASSCLSYPTGRQVSWYSTRNLSKTMMLGDIQSSDEKVSQDVHAWNMVYILYCSADMMLGQDTHLRPEGFQLSGHHILSAVIDVLKAGTSTDGLSLNAAQKVVFRGSSGGGVGFLAQLDWFAEQLPAAQVLGIIEGGLHVFDDVPYEPPSTNYSWTPMDVSALESHYKFLGPFLPESCATATDEPWRCMISEGIFPTLRTPAFFTQAQTDVVEMPYHCGVPQTWAYQDSCWTGGGDGCPDDVI